MGERRKRSGRAEPGVTSRTDGSLRSREADRALHRSAEKRPADWPAGLQSAAETCASLAHAALEQRDVAGARAQFEEGLRVLTPAGPKARWSYALGAGVSLCELDDGHGLDDALVAAVDFCQLALIYAPRDREPTLWAMAQTNLGRTLGLIGKRESGTARLEQAVVAFRAALEELTEEGAIGWAVAQTNLGFTLLTLGERESGTVRLEEAMVVLDACLTSTAAVLPPELIEELRSGREKAQAEIACRSAR